MFGNLFSPRQIVHRLPGRKHAARQALRPLLGLGLGLLLSACASARELQPFSSDGCSLFPDRTLDGKVDWCECCLQHDLAYWRGGTAAERKAADLQLKACILDKTGQAALASAMYVGVRAGGGSYFPTWYRWGYGWDFTPGYHKLTPEESALADLYEARYKQGQPSPACKPADSTEPIPAQSHRTQP